MVSSRVQMIALVAIGGLLGYVAASSRLGVFRHADAGPSRQGAADQAANSTLHPARASQLDRYQVPTIARRTSTVKCATASCCAQGSAKTQLMAMVNANLQAEGKRPNIVMLMTDDTGWNDFGCYSGGGRALGHPTPNVDRIAKEGAMFTSWYGQASCTAGRSSFITGRIPIRSALSVVVAPGDENFLRKETPTIAEFFKKNG
jgi:Sulfatase